MAGAAYEKIVNESIKQTMTRSFNTLATVVITLVALLALGGASLKNFAFALLVGICSGGYHSIFYSAPLVLGFRKRQLEAAAKRRRAGLSPDRTVTARGRSESAALQSRSGVPREDIVAARRERRQKAKAARTVAPSAPARYRKKRDDSGGAIAVEEQQSGDETMVDPLDAQNAGMHDAAMEQGHEEIALNFEELDPSTGSGQAKAPLRGLPPPTPSEAAFEAALGADSTAPAFVADSADEFVERVFATQRRAICAIPIRRSATPPRFHTKIAGVSFEGRQDVIAGLRAGCGRWSCAASRTIPTTPTR